MRFNRIQQKGCAHTNTHTRTHRHLSTATQNEKKNSSPKHPQWDADALPCQSVRQSSFWVVLFVLCACLLLFGCHDPIRPMEGKEREEEGNNSPSILTHSLTHQAVKKEGRKEEWTSSPSRTHPTRARNLSVPTILPFCPLSSTQQLISQ